MKSLTDCVECLAQLCTGTHLDTEARRVLRAIELGYSLYHPYPDDDYACERGEPLAQPDPEP